MVTVADTLEAYANYLPTFEGNFYSGFTLFKNLRVSAVGRHEAGLRRLQSDGLFP